MRTLAILIVALGATVTAGVWAAHAGEVGGSSAASPSTAGSIRCEVPADTGPSIGRVDWSRIAPFSLPPGLIAVWEGPHFDDPKPTPLTRGFSHVSHVGATATARAAIPPDRRALMIANTAYLYGGGAPPQPWHTARSPWGNDLRALKAEWDRRLRELADAYPDTAGGPLPDASLLCLDTERHWNTDAEILALRKHPATPELIRRLSDAEFVARYKKDMTALYAEAVRYFGSRGGHWRVTSYADVPVARDFFSIPKHRWQTWTGAKEMLNYLLADHANGAPAGKLGPLHDALDLLAPSAYFFYDYPDGRLALPGRWNEAGAYLGYLLHQIEANRARSDKPVIVFEWLHFHDCCRSAGRPIRPEMAQAAAIFPFMAGAEGIWLWEAKEFSRSGNADRDYSVYLHFVRGLERISAYPEFFEGPVRYVAPIPPPRLIRERLPVWRGIRKGDRLLVAAQNPYARDGEKTAIPLVVDGTTVGTVEAEGRSICLGVIDLPRRP